MKRLFSIMILVLLMAVLLTACGSGGGGGSDGGNSAPATAKLSTLCGSRFNLTEGRSCPDDLCKSGIVAGTAVDIGTLTFSSGDAMCTKRCNTANDCQGISFATTNNLTVAAENWACMSTSTGNFCAVSVTTPSGGGDSCSICGGAFCSGNCIGCPQCR
jgi:predicted small secreted protein